MQGVERLLQPMRGYSSEVLSACDGCMMNLDLSSVFSHRCVCELNRKVYKVFLRMSDPSCASWCLHRSCLHGVCIRRPLIISSLETGPRPLYLLSSGVRVGTERGYMGRKCYTCALSI